MDVLSTDDVRLAVHDLGGDGPPFLLCHATGFCGPAYEPLAAELAGAFHVWAIDFRGHGDSTAPAGDRFHWDGMTDDLLAAVDALGSTPIDVFGHSLGGGVAMLAEHRRPGTLRTAYLFEPIVIPALEGPRPEGPQFMSIAARRRRPSFPTKAEALYRYASRPPLDELRTSALYAYVEHGFADGPDGGVVLKCLPEHEALTFEADGKPTLDTVTTPTTVAIGTTAEEWTPALYGASIAEALPNGRLEQHPSLGHFGPLQDPIAIAAAITATARS
jgi:pimeloyl-ACP methyl ester carboxylesterase